MASRLTGEKKLRRTLRRIEPEMTQGVRKQIEDTAQAVVADALNKVPIDEGDLARSIDYKLGRGGFTAVIGPGAKAADIVRRRSRSKSVFGRLDKRGRRIKLSKKNRDLYWEFLKGVWIEFGTKGNAEKNIPSRPGNPFMAPAWQLNKAWAQQRMRRALRTALRRASGG